MQKTLFLYIFKDLLRVFLLASGAIALVGAYLSWAVQPDGMNWLHLGAFLGVAGLLALAVVIAVIGIVLLIGLVKKNGIMMVDFALDGHQSRNLATLMCHTQPFNLVSEALEDAVFDRWRQNVVKDPGVAFTKLLTHARFLGQVRGRV